VDDSVKALTAFPTLLDNMAKKLAHAPKAFRSLLEPGSSCWIVLALELSENAVRRNHAIGIPNLFSVLEFFDHTGSCRLSMV
jgi:hypothetical protein